MATIVINSVGTLGDLNPFLIIAKELIKKGHRVKLATLSLYENIVKSDGIEFCSIRPELDVKNSAVMQKAMDPKNGIDFLENTALKMA